MYALSLCQSVLRVVYVYTSFMYTQNATCTHFLAAQKSGRALQLSGSKEGEFRSCFV